MYGITLGTDVPLAVNLPPSDVEADLTFALSASAPDDVDFEAHQPTYTEGEQSDGRPEFTFWALPDRDVIRITGAMDFHCWPDRIACHLHAAAHRSLVETALFGMVLSLWLERIGTPTLHGSAVVIGPAAVAFLGSRGTGKTSTAAACVAAGHPLLSDDLLALQERDGAVMVMPAYPQLRMWPAQARHFFGTDEGFEPVDAHRTKLRVPVGHGVGTFSYEPAILRRVYLPFRGTGPETAVDITSIRPREAVMALIRESFLRSEVVRYGLQGDRLRFFATLLADIPVSTIRVPEGLEELPRVVAAIEADVGGGSA
ncbi:MAG: hypothetical protein H0X68_04720 [Chloroflexi bacterium]|nr:hypothetical protein [Chloroflexota bacterium]